MAASWLVTLGAKPPSSPTAVLMPLSCRIFFRDGGTATAAAPGEFTVADHGWYRASSVFDTGGYTPKVTIAGGTGNWAAVNGSWSVLPTSTTTFRIQKTDGTQLSTSGFGAVTGTITVTSKAPRLNDYHWWIRKFVRDGSGNMLSVLYGIGAVYGVGRARCDERTTAGKVEWR